MQIKDLRIKQDADLIAEVVEKGEVREFAKFGKPGRVCSAKIKDSSGQVILTLWNEQIDKINTGDKIKITKGYVSEWRGQLQVGTGRFGDIEVVEKGRHKQANKNVEKDSDKIDSEDEKDYLDVEDIVL